MVAECTPPRSDEAPWCEVDVRARTPEELTKGRPRGERPRPPCFARGRLSGDKALCSHRLGFVVVALAELAQTNSGRSIERHSSGWVDVHERSSARVGVGLGANPCTHPSPILRVLPAGVRDSRADGGVVGAARDAPPTPAGTTTRGGPPLQRRQGGSAAPLPSESATRLGERARHAPRAWRGRSTATTPRDHRRCRSHGGGAR